MYIIIYNNMTYVYYHDTNITNMLISGYNVKTHIISLRGYIL